MSETLAYIAKNIFTPVVVTFLGTQIWNYFLDERRAEKERWEKLYGPLEYYVQYLDELYKSLSENIELKKDAIANCDNDKIKEAQSQLDRNIDLLWLYWKKIETLFESNAGFISDRDKKNVKKFQAGYTSSILKK